MKRISCALLLLAGCLGDVEVPPDPPELNPVESPTTIQSFVLSGNKQVGTAILSDGEIVVPHDEETAWSFELLLRPGDNMIVLKTQRMSGLESRDQTEANIVYEPPCPTSPSVEPVPRYSRDVAIRLAGTKPAQTAIAINGMEVVPLDDETDWVYALALDTTEGLQTYDVVARDAKGRDSDPERVEIVFDQTPPQLAYQYPTPSQAGVPTNTLLMVTFDGEIESDLTPEAGIVTLSQGGQPVPGLLDYSAESRAITFRSMGGELLPNTQYEATVDPTLVRDLAGNGSIATPTQWTWTFTTGNGSDLNPPATPVLMMLPETVNTPTVELTGTKTSSSSIFVNGLQVVSIDGQANWTYSLPIVDTASITVASRSGSDVEVVNPPVVVTRVIEKPAPPVLDPSVPSEVTEPRVALIGTRPPDTSILLDGEVVACRAAEVDWSYLAPLNPGVNDLVLQTKDALDQLSDPLVHTVDFSQQYDGLVPNDFELTISFELRDLSRIPEIRSEFVTGENNFGIDAWVEGPIGLEETCVMGPNRTRQDIRYVGTIQHYIGQKAQHKVPFADDDYRGTDYLAALITGGAMGFLGLDVSSVRRAGDGREFPGLLGGLTEADLRNNIDCFGLPDVDLCTRATTNDGPVTLEPWTPRARLGTGLLEQGDYLLWIMINLDRDGSWLDANDFETCWDDPSHRNDGMHRVVQRISLGATPYERVIPQTEELSGADREGSGKLHFIGESGVVIRWGPSQ